VREEIEDRIEIIGAVSYFREFQMRGDTLIVWGEAFVCNSFSMINPAAVKGACLYVLTSGDYALSDREVLDQLFADMYGTSYLDAGRKILGDVLEKDFRADGEMTGLGGNSMITQAFGPGFYGMETGELKKIIEITNGGEIGVAVMDGGMMSPIQSCAGIHLLVDPGTELPGSECATCLGSRGSCNRCNVKG